MIRAALQAGIVIVCGGLPSLAAAQEPVVTLRATVTGNQEQPRVMYILPWQAPQPTEFEYQPAQALADDLFRRLDRDEYARELKYREALDAAASSTEPETN